MDIKFKFLSILIICGIHSTFGNILYQIIVQLLCDFSAIQLQNQDTASFLSYSLADVSNIDVATLSCATPQNQFIQLEDSLDQWSNILENKDVIPNDIEILKDVQNYLTETQNKISNQQESSPILIQVSVTELQQYVESKLNSMQIPQKSQLGQTQINEILAQVNSLNQQDSVDGQTCQQTLDVISQVISQFTNVNQQCVQQPVQVITISNKKRQCETIRKQCEVPVPVAEETCDVVLTCENFAVVREKYYADADAQWIADSRVNELQASLQQAVESANYINQQLHTAEETLSDLVAQITAGEEVSVDQLSEAEDTVGQFRQASVNAQSTVNSQDQTLQVALNAAAQAQTVADNSYSKYEQLSKDCGEQFTPIVFQTWEDSVIEHELADGQVSDAEEGYDGAIVKLNRAGQTRKVMVDFQFCTEETAALLDAQYQLAEEQLQLLIEQAASGDELAAAQIVATNEAVNSLHDQVEQAKENLVAAKESTQQAEETYNQLYIEAEEALQRYEEALAAAAEAELNLLHAAADKATYIAEETQQQLADLNQQASDLASKADAASENAANLAEFAKGTDDIVVALNEQFDAASETLAVLQQQNEEDSEALSTFNDSYQQLATQLAQAIDANDEAQAAAVNAQNLAEEAAHQANDAQVAVEQAQQQLESANEAKDQAVQSYNNALNGQAIQPEQISETKQEEQVQADNNNEETQQQSVDATIYAYSLQNQADAAGETAEALQNFASNTEETAQQLGEQAQAAEEAVADLRNQVQAGDQSAASALAIAEEQAQYLSEQANQAAETAAQAQEAALNAAEDAAVTRDQANEASAEAAQAVLQVSEDNGEDQTNNHDIEVEVTILNAQQALSDAQNAVNESIDAELVAATLDQQAEQAEDLSNQLGEYASCAQEVAEQLNGQVIVAEETVSSLESDDPNSLQALIVAEEQTAQIVEQATEASQNALEAQDAATNAVQNFEVAYTLAEEAHLLAEEAASFVYGAVQTANDDLSLLIALTEEKVYNLITLLTNDQQITNDDNLNSLVSELQNEYDGQLISEAAVQTSEEIQLILYQLYENTPEEQEEQRAEIFNAYNDAHTVHDLLVVAVELTPAVEELNNLVDYEPTVYVVDVPELHGLSYEEAIVIAQQYQVDANNAQTVAAVLQQSAVSAEERATTLVNYYQCQNEIAQQLFLQSEEQSHLLEVLSEQALTGVESAQEALENAQQEFTELNQQKADAVEAAAIADADASAAVEASQQASLIAQDAQKTADAAAVKAEQAFIYAESLRVQKQSQTAEESNGGESNGEEFNDATVEQQNNEDTNEANEDTNEANEDTLEQEIESAGNEQNYTSQHEEAANDNDDVQVDIFTTNAQSADDLVETLTSFYLCAEEVAVQLTTQAQAALDAIEDLKIQAEDGNEIAVAALSAAQEQYEKLNEQAEQAVEAAKEANNAVQAAIQDAAAANNQVNYEEQLTTELEIAAEESNGESFNADDSEVTSSEQYDDNGETQENDDNGETQENDDNGDAQENDDDDNGDAQENDDDDNGEAQEDNDNEDTQQENDNQEHVPIYYQPNDVVLSIQEQNKENEALINELHEEIRLTEEQIQRFYDFIAENIPFDYPEIILPGSSIVDDDALDLADDIVQVVYSQKLNAENDYQELLLQFNEDQAEEQTQSEQIFEGQNEEYNQENSSESTEENQTSEGQTEEANSSQSVENQTSEAENNEEHQQEYQGVEFNENDQTVEQSTSSDANGQQSQTSGQSGDQGESEQYESEIEIDPLDDGQCGTITLEQAKENIEILDVALDQVIKIYKKIQKVHKIYKKTVNHVVHTAETAIHTTESAFTELQGRLEVIPYEYSVILGSTETIVSETTQCNAHDIMELVIAQTNVAEEQVHQLEQQQESGIHVPVQILEQAEEQAKILAEAAIEAVIVNDLIEATQEALVNAQIANQKNVGCENFLQVNQDNASNIMGVLGDYLSQPNSESTETNSRICFCLNSNSENAFAEFIQVSTVPANGAQDKVMSLQQYILNSRIRI